MQPYPCSDFRSVLRGVQATQLRDADVLPRPHHDVQVASEGQKERNHQHEDEIRNGSRETRICFKSCEIVFQHKGS